MYLWTDDESIHLQQQFTRYMNTHQSKIYIYLNFYKHTVLRTRIYRNAMQGQYKYVALANNICK